MSRHFYLAMAPWVCFVVADRANGIGPTEAGFLAFSVSLAILAIELWAHRPSTLAFLAVLIFLADGVTSRLGLWSALAARYDRAMVMLALALALGLSLRSIPLTERYSWAEMTPRQAVEPDFRRYWQATTGRWTLAVSIIALSLSAGATWRGPVVGTVANWFLPLLLVAFAASGPPAPSSSMRDEAARVQVLTGAMLAPVRHSPFRPRLVEPGEHRRGMTDR